MSSPLYRRSRPRSPRAGFTTILGILSGWLSGHGVAAAGGDEPRAKAHLDSFDASVRVETYGELFRRALLPGPNGALVETDTVAALHHSLSLQAYDIDTCWRKDGVDVGLAAWERAELGGQGGESVLDGDVETANVRYRHGVVALRLGRQHAAGGAARYVRFDGLALGAALGAGFEA